MKIQLTKQINFISSKDSEETRTMYSNNHNIEIMLGNKTDGIIKKHFEEASLFLIVLIYCINNFRK